jgi:cytochrome c5
MKNTGKLFHGVVFTSSKRGVPLRLRKNLILAACGIAATLAIRQAAGAEAEAPLSQPFNNLPNNTFTPPPEVSRGQMLYENHCTVCHDSQVHVRKDRRATSAEDVAVWVRRWSDEEKLGWNENDRSAVTDYLVRRYYTFDGSHPMK